VAEQNKQCQDEVLLDAFSHCKAQTALEARDGDENGPEEPSLSFVVEPTNVSLPQERW